MELPTVSVIFVTYNRAHTLVATVQSLVARLDYPRDRLELIVCDDGSDRRNLDIIEKLPVDRVLGSARNRGLGANTNKGLRAATGDYVLQLQDDWLLVGEPDFLKKSIRALQANPDIAMVTFRDRPEVAVREVREVDGDRFAIIVANRDANGEIAQVSDGTYTDNPHVKRCDFHDAVGPYAEGVPMTKMEMAMSRAVAARTGFEVAVMIGGEVFHHIGDEHSFNPSVRRDRRMRRIQRWPGGETLIALLRALRHRFR